MAARLDNTNARQHGAAGLERRIYLKLPLAEQDYNRRAEIIAILGYDPLDLPPGPLGLVIERIADNYLLAERFEGARHYAAEKEDYQQYATLAQRSGWRNDKVIGQLVELIKLQSSRDDGSIEAAIVSAKGKNGNTETD